MCLYWTPVSRTRRERRPELGRCQDCSSDSKEACRIWNYKITQTHRLITVTIHGHSKTIWTFSLMDPCDSSIKLSDNFFTLVGLPSLRSPLSSWTGWVFMDWWIDGSVYFIGWFLIGWWTSILWHTLTTDRLQRQPLDSYWWDMSHESWVVSFPICRICHDFSLLPPSRQIVSYAKRRGPTMPRPNRQPCYTKQLQILCGEEVFEVHVLGKWCHWHCDQDVLYLVWI